MSHKLVIVIRKYLIMMEEKVTYNENLYSRQLGVFGAEAMGKLVKLRVFIQGLKGVRYK